MFRSILVPLDGSELAEQALPLALGIAKRTRAQLTLLQVLPLINEPLVLENRVISVEEEFELLQNHAQAYLNGVVERLRPIAQEDAEPVTMKVESLVGDAAPAIADYASKNQVDLIVMATHGRTGLGRWALGSVTDKVRQLTRTPMLVVRPRAGEPVRFQPLPAPERILVPLDGSELAEHAIPFATEIATLCQSELLLMRVATLPAASYYTEELAALKLELWRNAVAETRDYLQATAARLKDQGFKVRTIIGRHQPADSIIAMAERCGADLIVMTTHGRSGLSRIVYGSVADRVVRCSTCPVLVIRPPASEHA